MEEIHNLITGCFDESVQDQRGYHDDDSEEEDDDADMAFGFRDGSSMGGGKNVANYTRPKVKTGNLVDLQTGKLQRVRGPFHLPDTWWQVTILRTKTSKDRHKEPKDIHALCYRFRDDPKRLTNNVVHMLVSKVARNLGEGDIQNRFHVLRGQFEEYLRSRSQYDDLELLNLEGRLEEFCESLPEEEQEQPRWFTAMITAAEDMRHVRLSQAHPGVLHYGPQLFPFHFTTIISFDPDDLADLAEAIDEEPGNLAFRAIVSRKYNIVNCETSGEALTRSGLMSKVPGHVQDAIKMYELIKHESKDAGHTYVHFNRILDVLGPVMGQAEEALEFLNKNKVTKTQVEGGYRVVYLAHLWQAENKIARGLYSLQQREERQGWQLEVNFDRDDFESIRQDHDQLRAAKLITTQPVVAISGKGGCGKTYVVTKTMTAAFAKRLSRNKEDLDTQAPEDLFDDNDHDKHQANEDKDLFDDCEADMEEEEGRCPETVKLLLTAPTGKAANLLGKRAGMPSFTLHQVIWSHPPMPGTDWKHADINILVVDECSLVSVTTFSHLLEILLKSSQLRRVVLLGDIRQLPSIEPGNFLSDTFQSLEKIGCAVELRTNHRAESQLIVDNATRISKRTHPWFDDGQFIMRRLPESNPGQTGNDYLCQDINEDVTKLLLHEKLQSDVNSQFISFTRKVCDSINDLCCKKYSDHRTKENGKHVFRTGDKICCTRNGYIEVYTEEHGLMSCAKKHTQRSGCGEEESQGGVDRFAGEEEETQADPDQTASSTQDKKSKDNEKLRLCNGEIFFILDERERQDTKGSLRTFLQLSDRDPEEPLTFWVEKKQLRKICHIRHAWARTIHTFQGSETDHVVYIVGSKSRRQNWQHVYTAVTRGRKAVFIVSVESTLREAVKRSEIKRQTGLRKQLVEKFQKNPNFNATLLGNRSTLNQTVLATQAGPSGLAGQNVAAKKTSSTVSHEAVHSNTKGIMSYFIKGNNSRQTDENTTLNATQEIKDVLSSLAADHDDEEIDDYNSDDSDSLLTKLKPKPRPTVVATDATDDCNSDDSDSILKPRSGRNHSWIRPDLGVSMPRQSSATLNRGSGENAEAPPILVDCDTGERHGAASVPDWTADDDIEAMCDGEAMSDSESDQELSQSLLSTHTRADSRLPGTSCTGHQTSTQVCNQLTGNNTSSLNTRHHTEQSLHVNGQGDFTKLTQGSSSSSLADKQPSHALPTRQGGKTGRLSRKKSSNSTVVHTETRSTDRSGLDSHGVSPTVVPGKHNVPHGVSPVVVTGKQNVSRESVSKVRVNHAGKTQFFQHGLHTPCAKPEPSTSSPYTDPHKAGHNFHGIKPGNSPVTPGIGEPAYARVNSPAQKDGNQSIVDDNEEICDPKSNESQWSDINESDYLKIDDESFIQMSLQKKDGQNSFLNAKTGTPFTSLKDSLLSRTPLSAHLGSNSTFVTPEQRDISTNSLWSETDEEQYISLDLTDIQNMVRPDYTRYRGDRESLGNTSYHGINDNHIVTTALGNDDHREISSRFNNTDVQMQTRERTASQANSYSRRRSPKINIPDTPPSPGSRDVFESPPRSRSLQLSPGVKRQTAMDDGDLAIKRRQTSESTNVSPLKRSLAKLDFQ